MTRPKCIVCREDLKQNWLVPKHYRESPECGEVSHRISKMLTLANRNRISRWIRFVEEGGNLNGLPKRSIRAFERAEKDAVAMGLFKVTASFRERMVDKEARKAPLYSEGLGWRVLDEIPTTSRGTEQSVPVNTCNETPVRFPINYCPSCGLHLERINQ